VHVTSHTTLQPVPHASGTITFASRETFLRAANNQVFSPEHFNINISEETYQALYSLNGENLLALRNSSAVSTQLLKTAEGSVARPAALREIIRARLIELNPSFTHNFNGETGEKTPEVLSEEAPPQGLIHQLIARRAELKELQKEETRKADEARLLYLDVLKYEKEHEQLRAQEEAAKNALETLYSIRASLNDMVREKAQCLEELKHVQETEERARSEQEKISDATSKELLETTPTEEHFIRNALDSFQKKYEACERALTTAQTNYASSKAVYEALQDLAANTQEEKRLEQSKSHIQIIFCTVIPLILLLIGVPLFMHGSSISSLSYRAIGTLMVLFSLIIFMTGFVLMFKPSKAETQRKSQFSDAEWVMIQDEKKFQATRIALTQCQDEIAETLSSYHLGQAGYSLSQARILLDRAKELRQALNLEAQREQAAVLRRHEIEEKLTAFAQQEKVAHEHLSAMTESEVISPQNAELVSDLILSRKRQIERLEEALHATESALKARKALLKEAEEDRTLDRIKIEFSMVNTHLELARQEYTRHLIAYRTLDAALSLWEAQKQPQVYETAEMLLRLMTDDRWVKLSLKLEGVLEVTRADGATFTPRELSLGTRQQVYLSLRMALLWQSEEGAHLPLVADDILVNFDDERRKGAARAFNLLAQRRQVIMMTCHTEVVEAFRELCGEVNVLRLDAEERVEVASGTD
jgi:hypothetical protein